MTQRLDTLAHGRPSNREVTLSLWTAERSLAAACARGGVDRLGVDLEGESKAARQSRDGSNWFSDHRVEDLQAHQEVLPGRLFARTGEVTAGWPEQADRLVRAGASWLMLPNLRELAQVQSAAKHLGARASVIPMIENRQALRMLPDLIASRICQEVYFGPNDLSRSLGLPTRFHAMLDPEILAAMEMCRAASLPFGIGGGAAPQTPGLPVPAALVLRFLAGVGVTRLLLGRSFVAAVTAPAMTDLVTRVSAQTDQIRAALRRWPVGGQTLEQTVHELGRFANKLE